jgi:hypothetical protein
MLESLPKKKIFILSRADFFFLVQNNKQTKNIIKQAGIKEKNEQRRRKKNIFSLFFFFLFVFCFLFFFPKKN